MWQPPPGFPFHNTGPPGAGAAAGPAAAVAAAGGSLAVSGPGGAIASSGGAVAWSGDCAGLQPFMHQAAAFMQPQQQSVAAHSLQTGSQMHGSMQHPVSHAWQQQYSQQGQASQQQYSQQPHGILSAIPYPMSPAGGPRRRAFICGISYVGQGKAHLPGCQKDAACIEYLLKQRFGFPADCVLKMTDDAANPRHRPTRSNMMQGFRWLMHDLRPGDSLVFYYSGHGGQAPDLEDLEPDGMNETLCPLDYVGAGQIEDDELNRVLVNPLPQDVKLHCIIDACHSGSVMDLPYEAHAHEGHITKWGHAFGRPITGKGTSGGLAVQISAARDSQISVETAMVSGGTQTGAATYAFIKALERRDFKLTYEQLMLEMHYTIKERMLQRFGEWDETQDVVLAASSQFSLDSPFSL